jgi:hypothetical protein
MDVLPLSLVLYVDALPIGEGLQHPHQGLLEVLQVLPPLESCLKSDFREKLTNTYLEALLVLHLFTKFYQNCFCGLGGKAFLANCT